MQQGLSLITHYFTHLDPLQQKRIDALWGLYNEWNAQINVISRKDIEHLYEHHVLHSLAIAKFMSFVPGTKVMDVGTGGGFPGIPLAILFPETEFLLVDSVGKKIKVVQEVAAALELKNVRAIHERAEELNEKFDFIVSRAVTAFPEFYMWVKNKILPLSKNDKMNGILYLKGGDLTEELKGFKDKAQVIDLPSFFTEPFFETKKLVYFPVRKTV